MQSATDTLWLMRAERMYASDMILYWSSVQTNSSEALFAWMENMQTRVKCINDEDAYNTKDT